jgi:hypothetical protein
MGHKDDKKKDKYLNRVEEGQGLIGIHVSNEQQLHIQMFLKTFKKCLKKLSPDHTEIVLMYIKP